MFKRIIILGLMCFFSVQVSAQVTQEFLNSLQEMSTPALAARAEKAQVKAFEMFNELNDDAFFDVLCERVGVTGTRVSTMRCEPRFEDEISMMFNSNPITYSSEGGESAGDAEAVPYSDPVYDELFAPMGAQVAETLKFLEGSEWDKSQHGALTLAYAELAERINLLREENPEFHQLYTEYQAYTVVLSKR